jgi:hypothetical protein
VSHVLLSVFALLRRADLVEVIGAALSAKAAGSGARTIAAGLGRPVETVRGWLRTFAGRTEVLRVWFTVLQVGVGVDPVPPAATRTPFADAVAAVLGAVAVAACRRGVAVVVGVGGVGGPVAVAVLAVTARQHQFALMLR